MNYRPDIDGLRGIAVLAVLLYHFDLSCPGGYVGVDIFFVISGYLICQVLVQEIQTGNFRYTSFWERRLRRLMPALAIVLGATTAVGWKLLSPADYQEFGLTLAAQPLTLTNFVFWRTVKAGYFVELPETRPTLHTWSLAVEEQFYLLCPLALMIAFRINQRRGFLWAMLLPAAASLALSGYLTPHKPVLSYFLLPTRAFEILLGGLVRYLAPPPERSALFVKFLGFILMLAPIFSFNGRTTFPGFWALIPCLGSALLLWVGSELLKNRFLVGVGLISYSLYLWHWPILALWRYAGLSWSLPTRFLLSALSLAIACLSYRWIETPVRRRMVLGSPRAIFAAAGLFLLTCLSLGGSIYLRRGFPERWSAKELAYLAARENPQFADHLSLEAVREKRFIPFGSSQPGRPLVFLWGDSHAMALLPGIDLVCKELNLRGLAATNTGTPPFECSWAGAHPVDQQLQRERCQVIRSWLKEERPDFVFLVCRWEFYIESDYRKGLQTLTDFLKAEHLNAYFVLQVPRQQTDVPRVLAVLTHLGRPLENYGLSETAYRQQTMPFQSELDQVGFPPDRRIDLSTPLRNPGGGYAIVADGKALYFDDNHLSSRGSKTVAEVLRKYLKAK